MRVPWAARRSNQSILKEINPKYSLERLMLKLKLLYFGHLMPSVNSLEKSLLLGKCEAKRRRGWLDSTTVSVDVDLSNLWEAVEDRGTWHATVHGLAHKELNMT